MAQRTRFYHEIQVLIVFKQTKRFSVKSLLSQRFLTQMLGVFSINIFMCWKYAHYERVVLSIWLLVIYMTLKAKAKSKSIVLVTKTPLFSAKKAFNRIQIGAKKHAYWTAKAC
ncbi:MAG: hypothetical protein SOW45_00605 [Prevotella sp.]|nr:hypothetical protein [Prevotella sp.]